MFRLRRCGTRSLHTRPMRRMWLTCCRDEKEYGSSIESETFLHSPVRGSFMVIPGTYMTEAITITSLSRKTGVSTKALRYWESLGLLPETSRTHSGYRLFSKGMIRYVQFIRESKGLGLILKEIRGAMELF